MCAAMKSFSGELREADPVYARGKADDVGEETGKSTLRYRRGKGPGIQRRIRRDNIGKIPLAAGAGNNLQRLLAIGHKPKERRGRWDWHMSSYERRRRGNARRGDG